MSVGKDSLFGDLDESPSTDMPFGVVSVTNLAGSSPLVRPSRGWKSSRRLFTASTPSGSVAGTMHKLSPQTSMIYELVDSSKTKNPMPGYRKLGVEALEKIGITLSRFSELSSRRKRMYFEKAVKRGLGDRGYDLVELELRRTEGQELYWSITAIREHDMFSIHEKSAVAGSTYDDATSPESLSRVMQSCG